MSENLKTQLAQLSDRELLDFALEHLGKEHEFVRQSALQEHFIRVRNASSTVIDPTVDVLYLKSKLSQLTQPNI